MNAENFRVHKSEIATEMLTDARALFDRGHYFSAINLAGASAELLCKLCEVMDKPSPHNELKEMLKDFHDSNPNFFAKPSEGLALFYRSKNAIKHLNDKKDQFLIINPKLKATLYINQAAKALASIGVVNDIIIKT